jgi:ABC-type multidrug transport system ATPase subunit
MDLPCVTRLGTLDIDAHLKATLVDTPEPEPIDDFREGAIPVKDAQAKVLGKLAECEVQLARLSSKHCLIVTECVSEGAITSQRYWIVDLGSASGTFVDRKPILAKRLSGDELVQAGPFAWTFNGSSGLLVPASAIKGVTLSLQDVAIDWQGLGPLSIKIPPGQFVAIVGRSGSGKSSLLKAILGAPGFRDHGSVSVDGRDTAVDPPWFRSVLGYVSQNSVIHVDLRNRQFIEFSSLLRGHQGTDEQVETVLQQVDLPPSRWTAVPGELSGGQRKRLQTAAELINEPRLLLMDEPTSGLDPQRERSLLRLLRSLSQRGCTVVVVTHSLIRLEYFDRVLLVEEGQVVFDDPPKKLLELVPSGNLDDLDARCLTSKRPHSPPKACSPLSKLSRAFLRNAKGGEKTREHTPPRDWVKSFVERVSGGWQQFRTLLYRDAVRFFNRGLRRIVTLSGVPLLFAVAIHLAVPATQIEQLGFLSLLSVIWLGASLSLLAIADEREVFDHERLLFLRIVPYMAAKTTFYWLLAAFQAVCFFVPLWGLRHFSRHESMLYGGPWVLLYLLLLACAATGLGFLISASVGRNRQLATAILPLVMMVQIVFSAQVCSDGGNLANAYRDLHFHRCSGRVVLPDANTSPCPLYARWWERFSKDDLGYWRCDDCAAYFASPQKKQDEVRPVDESTLQEQLDRQHQGRPECLTIAATYATLSRYGDIVLRSFAYFKDGPKAKEYARWRREAVCVLVAAAIAMPALAGWILMLQTGTAACGWGSRRAKKTA